MADAHSAHSTALVLLVCLQMAKNDVVFVLPTVLYCRVQESLQPLETASADSLFYSCLYFVFVCFKNHNWSTETGLELLYWCFIAAICYKGIM